MNTQLSNTAYSITNEIFSALSDEMTSYEGRINTEIESGEMVVVFDGWYSVDGVCENDYYNGTGASYLTYASVSLSCKVYNEDGEEVANNYTDTEFERYLLN